MNTLAIALMIVIALLLAGLIILLIQGRPKADMTAQRLELLERRLAESMYDLRGEQSTLARAARLENQAASDRLSEQIDKRVARLADMTDQNLERIRMTVDERLNQSLPCSRMKLPEGNFPPQVSRYSALAGPGPGFIANHL